MDTSEQQQLWQLVWLGLHSQKEIMDTFLFYNASDLRKNSVRKHYQKCLAQKALLIAHSSNDHFKKLACVFELLNQKGILSIHHAGSTMSAGHTIVEETVSDIYRTVTDDQLDFDVTTIKGYCFYHEQDLTLLVPAFHATTIPIQSLYLAFGSITDNNGNSAPATTIGKAIVALLEQEKIAYEWSHEIESRIELKNFSWVKENDEILWENKAVTDLLKGYQKPQKTVKEDYKIGQKIRIAKGTFQNLEGIVKTVDRTQRTLLADISIFGRITPVSINFDEIAS